MWFKTMNGWVNLSDFEWFEVQEMGSLPDWKRREADEARVKDWDAMVGKFSITAYRAIQEGAPALGLIISLHDSREDALKLLDELMEEYVGKSQYMETLEATAR